MVTLSILDFSPIVEGSDAGQALRNSRDLAQHAERLGYHRFWMAEHHNITGVASAATAVAICYVAEGVSTLRVGAGGIMLPNHSPLVIAEQFGTLDAMFPGRIDLGIGRAPGSDQLAARAMRRNLTGDMDHFPQDVIELMAYFQPAAPGQLLQAVPGAGRDVPVWILGSSTYGAQLAAALGLPYAFASHFALGQMDQAIEIYRRNFRPSERLERPYLMLGLNIVAAATDDQARYLGSSSLQTTLNMRSGRISQLPPPIADFESRLDPGEAMALEQGKGSRIFGAAPTVKRELAAFVARTGADEVIVATQIFDYAARVRSLEIVAQVRDEMNAEATAPATAHA